MRSLLDSNAVLRYLLGDIPEQRYVVEDEIACGAEVTVEVVAECVYVLGGSVYGIPRDEVAGAIGGLLDEVDCSRAGVVRKALEYYAATSLDFVDCVLSAEKKVNGRRIVTFDKKLASHMERSQPSLGE